MILLELFLTFLKIGAFTFGGGYAMLPLIQQEVSAHGWMDKTALVDFLAISESTPGPFAVNAATYIGTTVGGLPGAVCATLGVVLPSFVIMLILAKIFSSFCQKQAVKGVMCGLRPAVVGLIASAVLSVGQSALLPSGISFSVLLSLPFWISLLIFLIMSLLIFLKKVHPIMVIVLSAGLGLIAGYAFNLPT